MSDAKPPSTTDLFLLIFGLKIVKNGDRNAKSGEDYYLNEVVKEEVRTLRDTEWNGNWFASPQFAWDNVRFRDWLVATLVQNLGDHKHDYNSLSEPLLASIDLLSKKFTRHMAGATDAINEALITKSGFERSFFTTLSVGVSKQQVGLKEVFILGAGTRRRAQLWLTESEALQADVEFFVPFLIAPNHEPSLEVKNSSVRAINAGIVITKSNGAAIGVDEKKELVGIRFNLRIPFKLDEVQTHEGRGLQTVFETPQVNIQKQVRDNSQSPTSAWINFPGWKTFVDKYCKLTEVGDLLNSPIGPLLAEKVDDGSGVKDIILDQDKRKEIKESLKQVKEDLDQTVSLLKSIWEWEPPTPENAGPHSSQRKLGSLLKSLGFMSSKLGTGGEFEYTFELEPDLTVWKIVNRILAELDGYPLYASGLSSRSAKEPAYALALASQQSLLDPATTYFGLAGLAYNKLLNPVSEKKATTEKKSDKGEKESGIVLSEDNFTDDESIIVSDDDEEDENVETVAETKAGQSTVEVLLHLGKWFSNESLDDNWFSRLLPKTDRAGGNQRVPLPGIRLLPFKRVPAKDNNEANLSLTFLVDLMSVGIDIKGTTKDGLTFLQGVAGHFGLGAVEVRLAVKVSLEDLKTEKTFWDRVAIGIGVKLKDLRLSLGPKDEGEKEKTGNEILDGLNELLADDWVVVPDSKPAERKVKTRLSAKKKDKFSISVGYLFPLKDGSKGTLDIQLYDEKGTRGKLAVIPIDRSVGPVYLRQIGIGLKGVENVELDKGLPESAQLTVALTGGIRLPVFELGFIGAKLILPLRNPEKFQFGLDGLDVSIKIDPVIISGTFMKVGLEYAGSLTIDIPKGSFSAMGFFGSIKVFSMSLDDEVLAELNRGKIHQKLLAKLTENKITPRAFMPVKGSNVLDEQTFTAADGKRFTITRADDKLSLLRMDKTFFVYVTLNAASGTGLTLGPITFTGIAFGYGYNRRMKVPTIEKVAEFPLVQIVMGEGGYQSEDESLELHKQLAKPVEDPISILEKMKDSVVPELGQQFACGGARFTISGMVDCFALLVVQWGGGEFEISLMGLARFRHPRDTTVSPICYVELQLLMTIKPSEGTFKLQALLTKNSWIINKDCRLTGGFALFIWFGGEHKGEFVLTIGGYHPRFRRPEHYPVVPRLGLNWAVSDHLSIKGGVYLAITPSCLMVGAKLEATFTSGRISAWFTAYLDVIINWSPFYFEAEIGISLRIEAEFFLFTIKLTIAASVAMWGPPVGGRATIDLTICSFDVDFGAPRPEKLELIETWQQFCHDFLNLSGGDRRAVAEPVKAFPIVQPNLAAGRNNLNNLPNASRAEAQPKRDDGIWKVRADELELAASATVPVTTLNVGSAKTDGVQQRNFSGQSMMVKTPVTIESALPPKKSAKKFGIHPMGKSLDSVLNVSVVSDEVSKTQAVPLAGWTMEEETGSLPAALWDSAKPDLKPEPSAKLIDGCITGIKRLKPPGGKLGKRATPPAIEWHKLEAGRVPKSGPTQDAPIAGRTRNIQPTLVQRQSEQEKIVAALSSAGFALSWKPLSQAEIKFRELQADPLTGAVAA